MGSEVRPTSSGVSSDPVERLSAIGCLCQCPPLPVLGLEPLYKGNSRFVWAYPDPCRPRHVLLPPLGAESPCWAHCCLQLWLLGCRWCRVFFASTCVEPCFFLTALPWAWVSRECVSRLFPALSREANVWGGMLPVDKPTVYRQDGPGPSWLWSSSKCPSKCRARPGPCYTLS